MCGAISPIPNTPSWCGAQSAGITLPFTAAWVQTEGHCEMMWKEDFCDMKLIVRRN